MKFRYFIINLYYDIIRGTNNRIVAKGFSESEYHVVIDAQDSKWLLADDAEQDIEEEEGNPTVDEDEDEDEDEDGSTDRLDRENK